MVEQLVDGNNYWCILPSDESRGYGEEYCRAPWEGELLYDPRYGVWTLHSIGADGSLDSDRNASSTISGVYELFETKEEATVAYLKSILNEAFGMLESCQQRLKLAGELLSKITPN